jgi:putative transposase
METTRNYKFRISAKGGKLKKLQATLDTCRFVFNKVLETRKTAWETDKKSIGVYNCHNLIKTWDIEGVHSQVLQNVSARVDLAFQGFFRRVKQVGVKAGYPRFKGVDRYDSFCFPQSGFKLMENGKKIFLSKVGDVKVNLHREIEGKIKTCTIKREGDDWYVIFSCKVQKEPQKKYETKAVGVDVGCIDFATMSDGNTIVNPHFLRKSEKQLKETQRKYSKLKQLPKDDKTKVKVKKKLVKLHCKVKNQRKDFLHKTSRKLVNDYSVICVEKLKVKDMLKDNWRALNKSIIDSGWTTFRNMLNYKAEEAGSLVVEVNPAYTSQICSGCGVKVKKELSERNHKCETCGLEIGRDLNAAKNILRVGMDSLSSRKVTLEAAKSLV